MPSGASRMRATKCPVCRGEAGTTETGGLRRGGMPLG